MSPAKFERLSHRQQIEHLTSKRIHITHRNGKFTPTVAGIILRQGTNHTHTTREEALNTGKQILKHIHKQAAELGIKPKNKNA